MSQISNFYKNQAAKGISGFEGYRWQRGGGIWGSLWSKVAMPVLKHIGRESVASGLSIAEDALDGKDIKESAMRNLKRTGRSTINYMKNMKGSGKRRKRRITRKYKKQTLKRRKNKNRSVRRKRTKRQHRKSNIFRFGSL